MSDMSTCAYFFNSDSDDYHFQRFTQTMRIHQMLGAR
ncbi:hypothetical protein NQ318_013595 [Aromia moschata]|uniref:Uncharacterized protein n=1 Tax=Aromia moschata TaxID=1265417 RepID=A0AAV8YL81_9CUCU|nr:hypothetical protein NQ318_013595 [Aromia moschata]